MHSKILVIALFWSLGVSGAAQTISSELYGISLPVPQGWSPRVTDTSLTVSSNQEAGGTTVVVGVQFSPSLSPYSTPKDWREQTMSAFIRYIQSNYGRLLTPNSKGVFQGDTTEDANYLALDPKSSALFAGQSRFFVRDGKGYELFVMGDTIPLYLNFPTYESLLNSMYFGTASVELPSNRAGRFELRRLGARRWSIRSDLPLQGLEVLDLRGRAVAADITHPDPFEAHVVLSRSGASPTILRNGSQSRLILP